MSSDKVCLPSGCSHLPVLSTDASSPVPMSLSLGNPKSSCCVSLASEDFTWKGGSCTCPPSILTPQTGTTHLVSRHLHSPSWKLSPLRGGRCHLSFGAKKRCILEPYVREVKWQPIWRPQNPSEEPGDSDVVHTCPSHHPSCPSRPQVCIQTVAHSTPQPEGVVFLKVSTALGSAEPFFKILRLKRGNAAGPSIPHLPQRLG